MKALPLGGWIVLLSSNSNSGGARRKRIIEAKNAMKSSVGTKAIAKMNQSTRKESKTITVSSTAARRNQKACGCLTWIYAPQDVQRNDDVLTISFRGTGN